MTDTTSHCDIETRGRDLRAARVEAGLSQRELRDYLRWDRGRLPAIENERITPTPDQVSAIIAGISHLRAARERAARDVLRAAIG